MKRKLVIGGAALALVIVAAGVTAAFRHPAQNGIPTFRVEPSEFRRQVTAEGTLKAVKATPITTPSEARRPLKIAWIETDGALVRKGDVVVRFDPTEFENELITGTEDRSTASNRLAKTNSQAATTRTNLTRDARQAESELEAAQRFQFDDAEIFSRFEQIESELDAGLAEEKKQYAEDVLRVRDGLARTDLDLIAIEDRRAGLRIRNAENGLKALEIVVPHDGILVLQRDWRGETSRVGSTMWPNSPIGEIPDLNEMKAEVFVLEADAAGLAVDQKATVWLESDPVVKYQGKVTSLDKIARPRMRGVPVQYFGVTVSLDRTDAAKMKPGARVRTVLEVENLKNAFAIPRQAMFEKEGKRLVYRKRNGRFEAVEVTISSSSAGRVVVTKGLEKGDELALRDPVRDEGGGMRDE
ncbi:MAG TPA: HlyD family efflux transporter periplasmic adaptor subunit [Thermoanaerobaculia bacterium]|nr:HlyD family efflux transporter periplasmic adaptor subunit [Thermoanaerobaculia bacterium]